MIIAKAVHQLQIPEDQVDFDDKLRVILDEFETPLKLYTGIVRRVVADGPDLTKEKRSNCIWDIQICFSTSPYARIGDVPIWLVTKDDAMLVAASESNTRQVVRTPEEYFKLLASPVDDFRSAVEASATAV